MHTELTCSLRRKSGTVACERCGKVAVGEPYEYPKLWDCHDVQPFVSGGRFGKALWKLAGRLQGISCSNDPPRPATVRLAQGHHSEFSHTGPLEHAVDVKMPHGTAILAGRDGRVVDAMDSFRRGGANEALRSKANFVVVRHDDGTYGRYFHLQYKSVPVKVGDIVKVGDLVGRCGSTGYSQSAHLHFDVMDCCLKETSVLELESGEDAQAAMCRKIESAYATFSAQHFVCAPLVLASPRNLADPKSAVTNSDEMRDKIILCKRGGNTFYEKALAAQRHGAVGLIIYDDDTTLKGVLPLAGGTTPDAKPVSIPVLMVSYQSGVLLKASQPRSVRIDRSPHLKLCWGGAVENTSFHGPVSQPICFRTFDF